MLIYPDPLNYGVFWCWWCCQPIYFTCHIGGLPMLDMFVVDRFGSNMRLSVHKTFLRLGQVRLGKVRLGQVRLGQVRLGQVRLGQVRLGQVRLGQHIFSKKIIIIVHNNVSPQFLKNYGKIIIEKSFEYYQKRVLVQNKSN